MGKPLEASLQWDDFRHIPQISILEKITQSAVKRHQKGVNILLYGEPGTGKTELAKTLGQRLECSLYSIGEQQGDIEEHDDNRYDKLLRAQKLLQKDENVLLLVDEADSFLQDRSNAVRNWEVTQINEMLTQMEKHKFPFVCTTNLMEKLDKASLRRFTFKVQYNYLSKQQRTQCFEHFFGFQNVNLNDLSSLTPGDFKVVYNKAEMMDCLNDKNKLLEMLEQELKNKAPVARHIGFL